MRLNKPGIAAWPLPRGPRPRSQGRGIVIIVIIIIICIITSIIMISMIIDIIIVIDIISIVIYINTILLPLLMIVLAWGNAHASYASARSPFRRGRSRGGRRFRFAAEAASAGLGQRRGWEVDHLGALPRWVEGLSILSWEVNNPKFVNPSSVDQGGPRDFKHADKLIMVYVSTTKSKISSPCRMTARV